METSFAIDQNMRVDWYIRLANLVIDALAIYIIAVILIIFAILLSFIGLGGLFEWLGSFSDPEYQLLGVILMTGYYVIMESKYQRTIGKFITGSMVISENGTKPSVKKILGRSLCRIFSIEAFSFLGAFPRGWHDSASGTYVVNAKKYKKVIELKNSFNEIGIQEI